MVDEITEAEEMEALNDMDEAQALTGWEVISVEKAREILSNKQVDGKPIGEEVLKKYKGPKGGTGSANMDFVKNPRKPKKEKRDNANPVVAKRVGTPPKKAVGKAGGTKVDVGSGRKVGTVSATPMAGKTTASGKAGSVKKTGTPVAAPKVVRRKSGEMPLCLCGCKERTKGGKFRPGHDARYYSALRKAGKVTPGHGKAVGPQLVKKAS